MALIKIILAFGSFILMSLGTIPASASGPRVLVVLSGSSFVSTAEGGRHSTGYFLSELALPVIALKRAGYEIVYATPGGAVPVMDASSDRAQWFADEASYEQARQLLASEPGLKKPRRLADLDSRNLDSFDGLFVPGGHAPLEDLAQDRNLSLVLKHFHVQGKPTALLCHGPAALLAARLLPGTWLYQGYQMTSFSTAEEKEVEAKGRLDGHLLYYVENELSRLGGLLRIAQAWSSQAVRDRELITGQNPMSEQALTGLFLEALAESRVKRATHVDFKNEVVPGAVHSVIHNAGSQIGYSTFFIGTKKSELPSEKFLTGLKSHVEHVREAFVAQGLIEYVFYATGSVEIAYQRWVSKEAADAAFASSPGKAVVEEAVTLMDPLVFKALETPIVEWMER